MRASLPRDPRVKPGGGRVREGAFRSHPVDAQLPCNVLQTLLTQILEREVEPVAHLIVHDPADANPARLGESFQARGDVDPIAVDVSLFDDDIAQIDAN